MYKVGAGIATWSIRRFRRRIAFPPQYVASHWQLPGSTGSPFATASMCQWKAKALRAACSKDACAMRPCRRPIALAKQNDKASDCDINAISIRFPANTRMILFLSGAYNQMHSQRCVQSMYFEPLDPFDIICRTAYRPDLGETRGRFWPAIKHLQLHSFVNVVQPSALSACLLERDVGPVLCFTASKRDNRRAALWAFSSTNHLYLQASPSR